MTPAELLIIYFAVGAPFGVYAFLSEAETSSYRRVLIPVLKFVVWPVFAIQLAIQRFSSRSSENGRPSTTQPEIIEKTETLRRDIDSSLVFQSTFQRRRLQEEFERFAGITIAVHEAERNGRPSVPVILEAGGHPTPQLGARCIFRRNRVRLLEHRNRAFEGFVAELGKASTNGGPCTIEELTERARKIATNGESWNDVAPSHRRTTDRSLWP